MENFFEGFDFTDFWDDSDYAEKEYIEAAPSDELIAGVEQELGYRRLPHWLKNRKKAGIVFKRDGGLWMSEAAGKALRGQLG